MTPSVQLDQRVALTERELQAWTARLRVDRRSRESVADEIDRAVEAAKKAGLVLPGQIVRFG